MENEILQDTVAATEEDKATEIITADTQSEAAAETQPAETDKPASVPASTETEEENFYMRGKKQVAIKHYKIGKLDFTNKNAYNFTTYALLLVLLAGLRSITTYIFTVPNGFAPGGVSGISTILYNVVILIDPNNLMLRKIFDPGITMLILNIPFIIAAFFVLGKKFAINTFFVVAVYSGLMFLLGEVNCPQFVANQAGEKILAALAGGSTAGFCLSFMLRHDMSMAGTDIVGKILHKRNPETGAQWWILICDCIVATCSGSLGIISVIQNHIPADQAILYVLSPILFSFIALITGSITTDVLQTGFQSSIVFNIITDKSDEIALAISEQLHRGVTVSTAVGYFTKAEHKILTCIVTKRQITKVKNIIKECDPNAFTYLTKAHEVAGKGFHSAG